MAGLLSGAGLDGLAHVAVTTHVRVSHWALTSSQYVNSVREGDRMSNTLSGGAGVTSSARLRLRHGPGSPRGWAVWELPAATRCLFVAVTALAASWATGAAWLTPLRTHDLIVFAVLLGACAASVEASRRVPEPAGVNANDMLGAWWCRLRCCCHPSMPCWPQSPCWCSDSGGYGESPHTSACIRRRRSGWHTPPGRCCSTPCPGGGPTGACWSSTRRR